VHAVPRGRPNLLVAIALLAAAAVAPRLPMLGSVLAAEAPPALVVDLNRSKLVSLPKAPHQVIVGDPAILQVADSPDGVTLTGLDQGETTMTVLDDRGGVVTKLMVRVESPSDPDIFVQRGLERGAYHCAPLCRLLSQSGDGGGGDGRASDGARSNSSSSPDHPKPVGGKGL
jgi:hypothetical protein